MKQQTCQPNRDSNGRKSGIGVVQLTVADQRSCRLLQSDPTVVSLAERVQASKSVLVVMSFSDDPSLSDAYESFKEICVEFGYEAARIDEENDVPRIMPELLQRLGRCAFCIVDLSHVKDIPVLFWESQKSLKEQLRKRIKAIAVKQGR
jgi:hypothetical protein